MEDSKLDTGILYLVGTPIGNLEDMTFRAVRILKEVDLIAAEDTRHTAKLLRNYQIKTPQISYHQHNQRSRLPELLERLHQGLKIALVTDAGMPGISDPGYEFVVACIADNISVIPIPGVTAGVTAIVASGLPSDRFVFEGFLPVKQKKRKELLDFLQEESRTLIFYESPHHLRQTLEELNTIFGGDRTIVMGRELTKIHEEFWRGTVGEALALYNQRNIQPRGEFTLIIAGKEKEDKKNICHEELQNELRQLLHQGMTRSQASRQLAQITSLPRRQIYQLALKIAID